MNYTPPKRRNISKEDRKKVYEKCNGHCAYCGCEITLKAMQVDHLIPMEFYDIYKAQGIDLDTFDNYMPSCRPCNHYKNTFTLETFRSMLERQPEILLRDSATYRTAVRFGTVTPTPHKITFYFEMKNQPPYFERRINYE